MQNFIFIDRDNMSDNKETINKRDLCNILTPELVTNLVNGAWCREDQGYIEKEETEELQAKIEKIGTLCDIIPGKYTYIKKTSK